MRAFDWNVYNITIIAIVNANDAKFWAVHRNFIPHMYWYAI